MNLKRKIGIVLLVCMMAAAASLCWYLLLRQSRGGVELNGTFVCLPGTEPIRVAV